MAYDRELVERIHALLASEPTLEQRSMFGGIGFMVDGNLTVAAMSDGGLLARVGRERVAGFLGRGVEQMEMKGRVMTGWLRISPAACNEDDELAAWVRHSVEFVKTLD